MFVKTIVKYVLLYVSLACLPNYALAKNLALLVGISDYELYPLEGPVNDVRALHRVLTQKWGFSEGDIQVLMDAEATKSGILAALDALYERSNPGDQVFIYFSGHGTSSMDQDIRAPLPTTSGAFIPYDIQGVQSRAQLVERLVVGRRDLRPRFTKFDQGQRHLFVAIDSCYSGNTVRGNYQTQRLPTRHLSFRSLLPKDAEEASSVNALTHSDDSHLENEEPYPYQNTFYLGASGEHERAEDIPERMLGSYRTIDNKPHGAFTNSLLEILYQPERADLDGNRQVSYAEVKQALQVRMSERGFSHTPHGLPSIEQDKARLAQRNVMFWAENPLHNSVAAVAMQKLRLKIHPKLTAIKQHFLRSTHIQLTNTQFDLALIPGEGDMLLLINSAGDLVAELSSESHANVTGLIEYQAWVANVFTRTGQTAKGMRINAALSGLAKGSTAVAGETLGFEIDLPDGGHLLILNYAANGDIQVVYPYTHEELVAFEPKATVILSELMQVTAPFGRDRIQVLALANATDTYRALPDNRGFSYTSEFAQQLELMLSAPQLKKAQSRLELVTTKRIN